MMNKIFTIDKIVKIGLRVTSFGHMIEVMCALYEDAYITALLAFTFAVIEYWASFYIKDCDCDDQKKRNIIKEKLV